LLAVWHIAGRFLESTMGAWWTGRSYTIWQSAVRFRGFSVKFKGIIGLHHWQSQKHDNTCFALLHMFQQSTKLAKVVFMCIKEYRQQKYARRPTHLR
jgi:hypothetical protein